MGEHRRGQFLVLSAAVLWSLGGCLAKLLALPGPTMACYRAIFAAAVLGCFLRSSRIAFPPQLLLMAVSFTLMNLTYVTAITLTTAANAIFLQYTASIWMFLGSVFWLREPVERSSLLGLVLGLAGMAIIVAWGVRLETMGVVLGLLSGLFYAGVVLCLRRLREYDELWLTFVNHAVAGGVTFLLLLFFPRLGPAFVEVRAVPGLFVFGAVQMAFPYVLFSRGVKFVTPQEAGVLSLLEPVLNPILAFAAVGEVPARSTVIGGALILSGVFLRCLLGNGTAANAGANTIEGRTRTKAPNGE